MTSPRPSPPPPPPPPASDDDVTVRFEGGLPTAIFRQPDSRSELLPVLHQFLHRLPGVTLDGEIGRGGSGVVFRGRDDATGRPVAVKVLRPSDVDEPRELARFVAEAETAAAVTHPNVARLYTYGEHDGRPYLVLEYCGGGSLAQRLRRDGPLSPPAAAELLSQVADGVHAVHQAGIVHRDVKPGNILFDSDGTPKVADFGLAKRQSSPADLTGSRAVLGSPAYMSPEQARGGTKFVGPQADVWALGVVLYECLVGVTPFAGTDPLSVLRQVTDEEPVPVRRNAPHTPRDLVLVVSKCLQKEPSDRYPTAAAVAADLRAFLAGQPVAASGPGLGRRLARWTRRNPGPAALTAGLVVSLIAGVAVSTTLALRYRSEHRHTVALLAQVQAERQTTWDALDALTDTAVERLIARQPVVTPADRAYLQQVLAQYDRAVGLYEDGAGGRRTVAHGQYRVARVRQRLGEMAAAEAGYRAGAAGFRSALEMEPDSQNARNGLANCLEALGWLLAELGRSDEGLTAAREAVAVRASLDDRARLGRARGTLGLVLSKVGRRSEAVAEYRAALADLEPTAVAERPAIAQVRVNLATTLASDPTTRDAAEAEYRTAVDEYDWLLAADPTSPTDRLAAVRARNSLGRLYATQGRRAEAVGQYRVSVGLARALVGELPGYPDHQHELARGLTLWATAEQAAGDRHDAHRRLDEAAGHHRQAVQTKPGSIIYRSGFAENRRLLAEVALAAGDHPAAAAAVVEFLAHSSTPDKATVAAQMLDRAARLARWDPRLSPVERAAAAARYLAAVP